MSAKTFPSFPASLAALPLLIAAAPASGAAGLEDYPPARQAEAYKQCVKILKRAKNAKSADNAAGMIGKLLESYQGKQTAMGEQGAPEADPKEEKRMTDKKKEKIFQEYDKELQRLKKADYFQSDSLRAAVGQIPVPPKTPDGGNSRNSNSSR
ncbi:MAG: hypothetical protein LUG84_00150 [Akkermansiaceae bacterium]|nr:hypothetical protein [Akkermansiaceae bacterium]